MKSFIAFVLAVCLIFSFTPPIYALDSSASNSTLPIVHGEGAYLIDVLSGQTLFMKNPDELLAPASTTKIMTGLLAIERGNLQDIVTASSTMLNNKLVYGTMIYLEPGEKMPLQDLLYGTLLNSANDAAVAIAEYIGGDIPHFVEMMNQRAREIGANQTHFSNPSGLTEKEHVTTAHDLALIARVAYQNPVFAQYVRTKSTTISRSKENVPKLLVNENKLLWRDSSIDGIKTGYTAAAQNCLVASVTKDGRQLIGVILKSPGREIYNDMENLLDYGFTQYKNEVYKPAGTAISSIMVNNQSVDLILDRPLYITQKLGEQRQTLDLKVSALGSGGLTSVEKGQEVAQVEVLEGDKHLDTFPLKASRTVQQQTPKLTLSSPYKPWYIALIAIGSFIIVLYNRNRSSSRYWRRRARLSKQSKSNYLQDK